MKAAILLTTRDKVRYTTDAVRSMFAQVGPPIELLLSDSGSVDGTRELLDDLARSYNGPHTVRRLNCPCAQSPGMPGLNAHLNWCMTQTDADVVMQLSGDDYDLAQRSELTIRAFEAHSPSMVLGAMYYVTPEMAYLGETPFLAEDRLATVEDMTLRYLGGSTCQAWTHEFWDAIAPMSGVGSIDVPLPFLACLHKGAYALKTRMHVYRKVLGPQNTGLEGVYGAVPEGDPRRLQLEELMHFQVTAGHYFALGKMQEKGWTTPEAMNALAQAILDRNASWVNVRQRMSFEGVPPLPFKV